MIVRTEDQPSDGRFCPVKARGDEKALLAKSFFLLWDKNGDIQDKRMQKAEDGVVLRFFTFISQARQKYYLFCGCVRPVRDEALPRNGNPGLFH